MDQFLWVEKYRPQTIDECILDSSLKDTFNKIAESGEIPNMLFTGTAGLGKTTVAKACEGIQSVIELCGPHAFMPIAQQCMTNTHELLIKTAPCQATDELYGEGGDDDHGGGGRAHGRRQMWW